MAPGAKLAFIDIGFDNGALSLPSDSRLLGTGRLTDGQGPAAHIHSASWGVVGENGYNYQCRSFDSYMYSNDDFLILVAAGNDGRYDRRNTVSAPQHLRMEFRLGPVTLLVMTFPLASLDLPMSPTLVHEALPRTTASNLISSHPASTS